MKKLFIAVVSLLIFGEIIRFDFGRGITLKPLDVGIGLISALWLVLKLVKKEQIRPKHILIPILYFAGFGVFSLLINYSNLTANQLLTSFLYWVRWVAYAGIFFVVGDFNKDFKKKIQDALLIIGSIIVGLGFVQYFFYSNLRNLYYLGWDEHMYRMFSVFLDPNFAGAFFVLFFLFLLSLLIKRRDALIGLLSALTLGAIFLTFSRSALIMLIASASLFFTLVQKKKLILVLLAVVFLVLALSSRYFNIENINLFRAVSSEARLKTAGEALLIFKSSPLVGVGFNAYRYARFNYKLTTENLISISHADAGTDNSFLFVLATTGIIGLILYLFLWFRVLKSASILAIVSILGIFVDSLFINSLFYPPIMLWLWMIIATKENSLS
jgi:O-antigen ligase